MGTNVWSIVFWTVAAVCTVWFGLMLIGMWSRFYQSTMKAIAKDVVGPSWVGPALKTIIVVGVLATCFTLAWNAMVSVTTTTSADYKLPGEVKEQKAVLETVAPNSQELDAKRAEQKDRAQSKPHKDALNAFDDAMAKEAEAIRKRNGLDKPAH